MLQRDGIRTEIVEGHYGELSVLVDGRCVLSAGPLGFIGVLPSLAQIGDAVRRAPTDTEHAHPADGPSGVR